MPVAVGGYFWQDGRTVKEYALKAFRDSAKEMLRRNDLDISQLRAFTGHQANLRVLEEVGSMIGLAPEQHWYNVDRCGNQGAAGVISARSLAFTWPQWVWPGLIRILSGSSGEK